MAATYNLRKTTSAPQYGKFVHRAEFEIDSTDTATYGAGGIAQNETIALFDIPAGSVFLAAELLVTTAQSNITDVDLGYSTDGSTNANLIDGVSLASTAYVGANSTGGGFYPKVTNSAVQLVFTNKDAQAITTAKAKVIVLYADMRSDWYE